MPSRKPTIKRKRPGRAKSSEAVVPGPVDSDILRLVRPDGLSVRRRRHDHGWSPRALAAAIESACFAASGLRRTLTPSLIKAIEEQAEPIPYDQLLLLADGLDCDPIDLIAEGEFSSRQPRKRVHS